MLYEARSMSGALLMVLCCNGAYVAARQAENAAKLYVMPEDRIIRTADLSKIPSEAAVDAHRFGEWINPAVLPV